MKKFMMVVALIVLFLVNPTYAKTVAKSTVNGYTLTVTYKNGKTKVKWNGKTYAIYHGKYKVKIVSPRKLTYKKLINRNKGKILYIEKIHGTVINNRGDGKTAEGSYICYSCLGNKVKKGDKVVTYEVYNPNNRAIDDIAERFDVPLKYKR